jgi:phosphoribosyl 1,2-cyclic phosphodiesterase
MDSSVSLLPIFEAAGVRGSHVVTDPLFQNYGGDTTCLVLTGSGGEHLIVDAGSGLFRFNPILKTDNALHLFISHPHVDHITGIFFLNAFYCKQKEITLYCSVSTQEALKQFFAPPLFPVSVTDVPSPPRWTLLPTEHDSASFETPGFRCEAIPIPHPGGASALHVTDRSTGHTLLVLNDCELMPDQPFEHQPGLQPLLACLGKHPPLDSVIIDAMYEPEELKTHQGWGHSDFQTAIRFGLHIHAKQIYLSHHNPTASDALLQQRQASIEQTNVTILRQNHRILWRFSP